MTVRCLVAGALLLAAARSTGAGVGPVSVSGTDADAFRLTWPAVDGARGYIVNVWTNGVVGASEGEETLHERFSGVPNRDYTGMWSVDDINRLGDYRHWTGELVRGYPSRGGDDLEHAVVLGTERASGWLKSAPLEVAGEALVRLRLTRHTDDDTAPVLVAFVKDGVTNFSARIGFGTAVHSFSDCGILASNLTRGCRLLVSSQKKANGATFGRVAVAGISVRSGYSAGTGVRVPVVRDERVGETCFSFAGARPVSHGYSVAAQGEAADPTPAFGEVDMGDPPWLRCWRTSVFLPKPGCRVLSFSWLDGVESARDWVNGVDGDGLYAFSDADAGVKVRRYRGSTTYGGIYRFSDGSGRETVCALGLLGVRASGVHLVLPVRLDCARPVEKLSAAYVLRRLARDDGTADTPLAVSWKTSDDIREMEWLGAGWTVVEDGGYVATADGAGQVERRLEFAREALGEAKYLFLRWSVPKQANSAMIGLAGLTLSGTLRKMGFKITVR